MLCSWQTSYLIYSSTFSEEYGCRKAEDLVGPEVGINFLQEFYESNQKHNHLHPFHENDHSKDYF